MPDAFTNGIVPAAKDEGVSSKSIYLVMLPPSALTGSKRSLPEPSVTNTSSEPPSAVGNVHVIFPVSVVDALRAT